MPATLPDWRGWPLQQRLALRDRLAAHATRHQPRPWRARARPKQLPPDDPRHGRASDPRFADCRTCQDRGLLGKGDPDWLIWLLMSGRGFGKTDVGSNWLAEQAIRYPGTEWAIFAPTFRDVRKTCIEASTGLLAALRPGELVRYRRNDLELHLIGGSTIFGYSADQPERIRGANLSGAWCEETGSWRYLQVWYEGLIPALRISPGKDRSGRKVPPRVVVTTTPRPIALIKDLARRDDGTVHVTQGSTWENASNLSAIALQELERRYSGTRIGSQELEGDLLSEVQGSLWKRDWLDRDRIALRRQVPSLVRVVVGVDPAVTSSEESDAHGIVVVGLGGDGHLYVLGDYSGVGTPNWAMRRTVMAYRRHRADLIVAEVNNGGDFVEALLRTVDEHLPYRSVHASRGKVVRAEPISSIYEQGRAHHVGTFGELEGQLTTWLPTDAASPDRLDALVWACTELTQGADWSRLYGDVHLCPRCDRMSIKIVGRTRCPYCDQPFGKTKPLVARDDEMQPGPGGNGGAAN